MPDNYFDLNIKKSSLEINKKCVFCNALDYKFKMENLVIDRDVIKDCKLFSLNQFAISGCVYVTETGLKPIIEQNFTNFQYQEAGWIE